jgi:hypothetical protein
MAAPDMATRYKALNVPAAIAVTGLIAGTLDISAATAQYMLQGGKNPVRILEYIASAVFGRGILGSGSVAIAAAGLLFHYLIAYAWTTLFYLAYPHVGLLRKNPFAVAVGYGLLVWLVMNRIVVPLSRIGPPTTPFDVARAATAAGILVVCIGLPLALRARRDYSGRA